MFPLVETIIGFVVIMLMLSFLAKSLCSVFKNHFEFYSGNFKCEVERLIRGTIGGHWTEWENQFSDLKDFQWKRLGEQFLDKKNMEWLLKEKLNATGDQLKHLDARVKIHVDNIRYAFEKRNKNITLALGISLCLFMNINAFTIWYTLYHNQDVRAKFASQEYVDSAERLLKEYSEEIEKLKTKDSEEDKEQRKKLEKQLNALQRQVLHFRGDVSFGVGKIWNTEMQRWPEFFYEFFGSLLTGILISIGAPYWHDILRALASFRKK